LLARYHRELAESERDDVITDRPQQENWYGGPRADHQSHWVRLKGILLSKRNWSSEMIESLDVASTSVLGKITNPRLIQQEGRYQTKGLVLGYVQSGKTANYSALIAKAIDAG